MAAPVIGAAETALLASL